MTLYSIINSSEFDINSSTIVAVKFSEVLSIGRNNCKRMICISWNSDNL
jgi:hypothetical protein